MKDIVIAQKEGKRIEPEKKEPETLEEVEAERKLAYARLKEMDKKIAELKPINTALSDDNSA